MSNSRRDIVFASVLSAFITTAIIVGIAVVFREPLTAFVVNQAAGHLASDELSSEARAGIQNAIADESRIIQAVEESLPSVVSVIATKEVSVIERYYERSPGFGFLIPQFRERGTEEREVGGGTGFFVSSNGLVVTNRHVVEDTEASYTIVTHDGEHHEAEVVARDPVLDIAILSVESTNYPALSFGNSSKLKLGQGVIAIGNALGEFEGSVSTGVVSGLSRSIIAGGFSGRPEQLEGVIQTDAAINPGNSGGPLLNLSGEVVGVNVAMAQGSENIGFAIPSDEVKAIVDSVEETGEIVRPFLGVRYIPVTKEVQERFDLSVDHGVLLIGGAQDGFAVEPGSAADSAGLKEGDMITSIDGEDVTMKRSFALMIRSKQVGQTISLEIVRDGETLTLEATLEKAE